MDEYDGEEFETKEPLLLFSIGRSYCRIGNAYGAVRYAWRVNRSRVERYKLVPANFRGMIVGAYRPAEWLPATKDIFLTCWRFILIFTPRRLTDGDSLASLLRPMFGTTM